MSPAWSPDGSLIAFTRAGEENPRRAHLYLMQANGSGQTQITKTLASDWNPVWQPLPSRPECPFRTISTVGASPDAPSQTHLVIYF